MAKTPAKKPRKSKDADSGLDFGNPNPPQKTEKRKASEIAAEQLGGSAGGTGPMSAIPPPDARMEWSQSDSIDKLAKSMVAFRKIATNPNKDKAGYNYKYTTLANLIDHTKADLVKCGLAITQFPINDGNSLGCMTMLMHESGQFIRCRFVMPIPILSGTNMTQNAGAAVSYARRYARSAVLDLASDDDTDASFG